MHAFRNLVVIATLAIAIGGAVASTTLALSGVRIEQQTAATVARVSCDAPISPCEGFEACHVGPCE